MNFEEGNLYHIYNQGNNRQKIFFNRENYLFFLKKIRSYITPYADILAWCLMPNHFHLMIHVRVVAIRKQSAGQSLKERSLNDSIAILLRSYTRAVNKAQKRSGSLFRMQTKAICLNEIKRVSPVWYVNQGVAEFVSDDRGYAQTCFNYIHQNPVKANLVKSISDWEFSSAQDYLAQREGKLINRDRAAEYHLECFNEVVSRGDS
ncbi:MAG: transposase [Marinifilaceae bacterium]